MKKLLLAAACTLASSTSFATQTVSCTSVESSTPFYLTYNAGLLNSIQWLTATGDGPTDAVRVGPQVDSIVKVGKDVVVHICVQKLAASKDFISVTKT